MDPHHLLSQLPQIPIHFWLPCLIGSVTVLVVLWMSWPSSSHEDDPLDSPLKMHDLKLERSDQRTSTRRGGNPMEIRWRLPEESEEHRQAYVIDRSLGGFRLLAPRAFEGGTILTVLPVEASDLIPWVEVEVRSCKEVHDGFEIGARFLKMPPYSILMLFG